MEPTEVTTKAFGQLKWSDDEEAWQGQASFLGTSLPLGIEFDADEITDAQHKEAVENAGTLFEKLTQEWEEQLRSSAAREFTQAAYCQGGGPADLEGEATALAREMAPREISFVYSVEEGEAYMGTLVYKAATRYPESLLQVNFLADLSLDEAVVLDV